MELRANVIVSIVSLLEKLKGFKIFNLKLLSLFLLMCIGTILQLNFFRAFKLFIFSSELYFEGSNGKASSIITASSGLQAPINIGHVNHAPG